MKYLHPLCKLCNRCLCLATLLLFCTSAAVAQSTDSTSTSHLDLSSNECLKQLNADDIVIASIAFNGGLDSMDQLKELVRRKPWGNGTEKTTEEIQTQLETQSPFLVITLTKQQALTLDNHRDIIKWILVQSPTKVCK